MFVFHSVDRHSARIGADSAAPMWSGGRSQDCVWSGLRSTSVADFGSAGVWTMDGGGGNGMAGMVNSIGGLGLAMNDG